MTLSFLEDGGHPDSQRRAIIATIAAVALWALIEVMAGVVAHRVSQWQIVFVRYTVHLAIVLLVWGRSAPWRTKRLRTHFTRSALMLAMPASAITALSLGADGSWLMTVFWSAPLQLLVIAAVLERERVGTIIWLATAVGWIAAWASRPLSGFPSLTATVFGLTMGGSFAAYIVMTRGLRDEPLRTNTFFTALVPWIGTLLLMPHFWTVPTIPEFLAMVFIGAGGWFGLIAIDRFAGSAPVSQSAPILYLQIAGVMLLETILGHRPSALRIGVTTVVLCATLVLAALGLANSQVSEVV